MPLPEQPCQLIVPGGRHFVLRYGTEFRRNDLPHFPSGPADEVVARVSAKPGDDSVLGITNLSPIDWIAESPRKGRYVVAPGQTVRIEPDVKIQFGNTTVEIKPLLSVPLKSGWYLRIISGPNAGQEVALTHSHLTLGGAPPAGLVLPAPQLPADQIELDIVDDHILIRASGDLLKVNGKNVASVPLRPNDEFQLGNLHLRVINQQLAQKQNKQIGFLQNMPAPTRNGVVVGTLAGLLILLFALTDNFHLLPVALIALSLVVPIVVLTRIVETYNTSNISINTLLITFLLGGSLGMVATILPQVLLGMPPIMFLAGIWEEPAKLLATFWRWKHPVYDKPMDGLIIGTAAGFGFAVAETAGYGLDIFIHNSLTLLEKKIPGGVLILPNLSQQGLVAMLLNLIFRNLLSPYGHCLWTGILCAAFWESGRSLKKAVKDPRFLKAFLIVVLLHGLWDSPFGLLGILISAGITSYIYKERLKHNGYSQ